MGMEKWISRKEEDELPKFKSHDEARAYFKEKYGDAFQLMDSIYIDGKKCYLYFLIHDKEAFWEGQRELKEKGHVEGMRFVESHQPIEIWESGEVHIIH
jgi:hypothetical protein